MVKRDRRRNEKKGGREEWKEREGRKGGKREERKGERGRDRKKARGGVTHMSMCHAVQD